MNNVILLSIVQMLTQLTGKSVGPGSVSNDNILVGGAFQDFFAGIGDAIISLFQGLFDAIVSLFMLPFNLLGLGTTAQLGLDTIISEYPGLPLVLIGFLIVFVSYYLRVQLGVFMGFIMTGFGAVFMYIGKEQLTPLIQYLFFSEPWVRYVFLGTIIVVVLFLVFFLIAFFISIMYRIWKKQPIEITRPALFGGRGELT